MSKQAIQQSFNLFNDALQQLQKAVEAPQDSHRFVTDSTIQRFEFTYELLWKLLKKILESEGVQAPFPRVVLQEAYAGGLIDDEATWLGMLKDRNLLSHVYHKELADEIYHRITIQYYPLFVITREHLAEKIGNTNN